MQKTGAYLVLQGSIIKKNHLKDINNDFCLPNNPNFRQTGNRIFRSIIKFNADPVHSGCSRTLKRFLDLIQCKCFRLYQF